MESIAADSPNARGEENTRAREDARAPPFSVNLRLGSTVIH